MNGCRNWDYQWPLKKCWRSILLSHIEKGSVIYSRKNLIKWTSLLTNYHCFEVRKLGYRTDESTVWARACMCMCTPISFSQVFKCPVQISSLLFFFFKPRFYLFIHERHTREGQRPRQKEKQAPCREHDVGLNLGFWDHAPG